MPSQQELKKTALLAVQKNAAALFHEVETRGFIQPGISEKELNQKIYDLAFELFGIKKYWHKRIVRAGKNTLCPYRENPPNLMIATDDIIFFDFGPVFEEWEADFGRTYVLGNDAAKLKIMCDIEAAWYEGKVFFDSNPNITGAELYSYVRLLAEKYGWEFGQDIAGHLIGNFPHEKIQGEEIINYIHSENKERMRSPDNQGNSRDWILEIHFVDRKKEIGGFFEQLLT